MRNDVRGRSRLSTIVRVGAVVAVLIGLQGCGARTKRATLVKDDPLFVEQLNALSQAYTALDVDAVMGFYDEKAFSQSFGLTWKATQGAGEQRQALQAFLSEVSSASIEPAASVDVWREGQARTWTTRPLVARFTMKNGDAFSFSGYHSAIWEPRAGVWQIWYENFWGTVNQTAWAGSPTPPPAPKPDVAAAADPGLVAVTTPPPPPAPTPQEVLQDVFFDYDKHNIRPDQVQVLKANAEFLVQNPGVRILLQGHCDERGSRSYNLRLGQRRADAVKRFLIQQGVAAERIDTVSFGKDKPFVAGIDERTWQLNRRVHFVARP